MITIPKFEILKSDISPKKKILIITRDYPPYCANIGWMIRMANLCNNLASKGVDVYVIAAKRVRQWDNLVQIDDRVKRYYVKAFTSYYDVPKYDLNVKTFFFKVIRRLINNTIGQIIVDLDHIDLKSYFKQADDLIKKLSINNILISSPPHSLQLIGRKLKKRYGDKINVISDYRDPWSIRPKYMKKLRICQRRIENVERSTMLAADHVVFNTFGLQNRYTSRYPMNSSCIVQNGYGFCDQLEPNRKYSNAVRTAKEENRIVLGYFGMGGTDQSRNDGKDLSILWRTFEENKGIASRFMLITQGYFIQSHPVPNNLLYTNFRYDSYDVMRANMKLIDVGFHIYSTKEDADVQIGGKVYDYIGTGLPIFIIAPKNAFSLQMLAKEIKSPFFADIEDKLDIVNKLNQLIDIYDRKLLKEYQISNNVAVKFSREKQNETYLRYLI